jgi:hypothetical protein
MSITKISLEPIEEEPEFEKQPKTGEQKPSRITRFMNMFSRKGGKQTKRKHKKNTHRRKRT